MNTKNNTQFEKSLRSLPAYQVSAEKDQEILRALRAHDSDRFSFYNFFTFFTMKRVVSTALAVVLVVGGVLFYNRQNSYAYHLGKAQAALAQLQVELKGGSTDIAWVPAARAQAEVVQIDEEEIAELAEEVVEETEIAIELAEDLGDAREVQEALEEINDVQEETVETLIEAVEVIESEEIAVVVAEALETTSDGLDGVEEALMQVADAVESGAEEVEVDVETTTDEGDNDDDDNDSNKAEKDAEKLVRAEEGLTKALTALEVLKASGVGEEEVEKLEAKFAKIEAALEEGKVGRAFGLSTAIQVQSKHILKKTDKKHDKEDKKKDKDEEKEMKHEKKHDKDHDDDDDNKEEDRDHDDKDKDKR